MPLAPGLVVTQSYICDFISPYIILYKRHSDSDWLIVTIQHDLAKEQQIFGIHLEDRIIFDFSLLSFLKAYMPERALAASSSVRYRGEKSPGSLGWASFGFTRVW